MKISTKFGTIMLGIILTTVLLMFVTISSLNNLRKITSEHQNKNNPMMITSLGLQKDVIQIQQWLTDISATRAKPGYDDGFNEAENYYKSAKDKIEILKNLGIDSNIIETISKNLDEYYKLGIEMANVYIKDGTDAGNTYMEKFDPYATKMEESVNVLLQEANTNFNAGNNTITSSINNLFQRSIALFSIVILISIFSFIVIQKVVIKRLSMMTEIIKDISEGDGDLTKRVNIKSKDEIGEMAMYFNNFADTVNSIVSSVKEMAHRVDIASKDLTATTCQSANAAKEVEQTINEIANNATSQAHSTAEGSEKLLLLGSLIEENKDNVDVLTMASNEVNDLIGQGLNIINELEVKTDESSNAINSAYVDIIETNKSSEKISEASNLITSIAEQTNLLALNASIEAARAGENGKGFAVVAEEIRNLAEQSKDSTNIINEMIGSLQQNATKAVKTMEEVETILKEQFENVNHTESKYKEIAVVINKFKETVEVINEAGDQMGYKKDEVLGTIQSLSAVADENAAGTEQALALMHEQTASIDTIAESSTDLARLSQELQVLIERFKV